MHRDHGERGIVIADRYRAAGALRRAGLIDAIDLEAPAGAVACRLAGIAGDEAGLDAWEDAWREAQEAVPIPRLREVVVDDDGAAWAVLDASAAVAGPPAGAVDEAREIGATLARVGLDAEEVTAGMLGVDAQGRLVLDGVVRLGGGLSRQAAGAHVAALLPPAGHAGPAASPSATRSSRRQARRSARTRRRLALPIATGVALLAAAVVLVLPGRSDGTVDMAPGPAPRPDVVLGSEAALAAAAAGTTPVEPPLHPEPSAPGPSAERAAAPVAPGRAPDVASEQEPAAAPSVAPASTAPEDATPLVPPEAALPVAEVPAAAAQPIAVVATG